MPQPLNWSQYHHDRFKNTRVLVTGGAGFIGSHLSDALAKLGASVVVLDDLSGGSKENIDAIAPVQFLQGSILDQSLLEKAMTGCQYVFHQAALGSVPYSVREPRLFHDVNVTGTVNVLELARKLGVQRVMFAASSSAYGDSETLPKIETMPVNTVSPYASTKVACECMMRAYAKSYGLDTVALRYFNIYGPRQNANSAYAAVIAAFAAALLSGKQPVIYGDGQQSRDFTFVANAVHANLLAASHATPLEGQTINVAIGQQITLNQLLAKMASLTPSTAKPAKYEPPRAGDVKHSLASLEKAKSVLNYSPIVDFDKGLEETFAWYKSVT